jgi:hypothetical protein
MSVLKYTDEDTLVKKAVEVLLRELGPVDTMRFVAMPRTKRLESVKRHREWQKTLKKDPFFDEVFTSKV